MIKPKLSLVAILSTTAIASGIVLTSVSSAACPLREYRLLSKAVKSIGYALLGSCLDIAWNSPGSEPLRGVAPTKVRFEPNHSERERPSNRIY